MPGERERGGREREVGEREGGKEERREECTCKCTHVQYMYVYYMYMYMYVRVHVCTCTCMYMYMYACMYCTRPLVQSRVAAGFSQFSKNIPKPFLMYMYACAEHNAIHAYLTQEAV